MNVKSQTLVKEAVREKKQEEKGEEELEPFFSSPCYELSLRFS